MALKTITVFCGSKLGNDPRFEEGAKVLGECMVKNKINLIYGGGTVGLMGAIAKTVADGGCEVTGFLPEFFVVQDRGNLDSVGKTVLVQDMHTRKRNMLEKADAMIALPGGYGTFEELLEMITWVQLGLHDKPIGVLNIANYWGNLIDWTLSSDSVVSILRRFDGKTDTSVMRTPGSVPLVSQIQNAVKEGFVYGENQDILIVADDCETLLRKLQERAANKEQSTHKILPNM